MSHDVHFLERLQRVSPGEADLALGLYRDSELVSVLLGEAHIPDGCERVAVALAPGDEPPHVVLARDGGFVTCLARGMAPRGLPVVAYRLLSSMAGRLERLRASAKAYRELSDSLGPRGNAYERMFRAGNWLSREEAQGLKAVEPELGKALWRFALERIDPLNSERPEIVRRRGGWREPQLLRQYYKSSHAFGHSLRPPDPETGDQGLGRDLHGRWMKPNSGAGPLARPCLLDNRASGQRPEATVRSHRRSSRASSGSGGLSLALGAPGMREAYHADPELSRETALESVIVTAGRTFSNSIVARTAWALAQIGKPALPSAKQALVEAVGLMDFAASLSCLVCLGVRHERLRAEIDKVLERPATSFGFQNLKPGAVAIIEKDFLGRARRVIRLGRETPVREKLRTLVFEHEQAIAREGELQPMWADASAVPDRLLPALAIVDGAAPFMERESWLLFVMALPLVAHADLEDLYLSRDELARWFQPFDDDDLKGWRGHLAEWFSNEVPVHAAPKVARNEPCPCGSGRKFKKCCAHEAA